ncbi:hypothetical protein IDZ49_10520, partial [Francisella tularensis]|nr:hypothetical protein [Francisella tularensis]
LSKIRSILAYITPSPVLPLLDTLRNTNTDICSQNYSIAFEPSDSGSIVSFDFTNISKVSISLLSNPSKATNLIGLNSTSTAISPTHSSSDGIAESITTFQTTLTEDCL